MKKYICALMIVVMLTSVLIGCTRTENTASEATVAANTTSSGTAEANGPKLLFNDPVKFTLLMPSSSTWPYREDWLVFKLIKEKTNVTFDVLSIPDASYQEKVSTTIASGEMPDLMYLNTPTAKRYGIDGALINVLEYENDALNFSKWRKASQSKILGFLSADGGMYQYPAIEIGEANRMGWLYRKDIFEKNNLKVPQNEEEFYQVCKKLKELYPESFPFIFRDGGQSYPDRFEQFAPSWGANITYFYDRTSNTWKYGPLEDGFKNMIGFFNKLYTEKLIPTDFLTVNTQAWSERISAGQSFITYDYLTRIDYFNVSVRKNNPEFTMYYMPPFKGGASGTNMDIYTSENAQGFCVSSKSKMLKEAVKIIDWMYTDEAALLLSWGVEGITYKVEGGKKKLANYADLTDFRNKTGLSTGGTYTRFDYDAHISTFSPEMAFAFNEDKKYDMEPLVPSAFTSDEQQIVGTIGQTIDKKRDEMNAKLIISEKSMDEWGKYMEEVKNLGLDKMLQIYDNSFERMNKAMN